MRKKDVVRTTAWLLAAVLAISQAPLTALAENSGETKSTAVETMTEAADSSMSAGEEEGRPEVIVRNTVSEGDRLTTSVIESVSGGDQQDVVLNNENGIPDKALYDALVAAGDSNGDGVLLKEEAISIQYLTLFDFAGSLANLSIYVPNLLSFGIRNVDVSQISSLNAESVREISQLVLLNELICSNIKLTDAYQLGVLHRVTNLSLYQADLSDISFINASNYPELKFLSLSQNPIYELPQEIGELTSLISLDLSHCRLRKLVNLGALTALDGLGLQWNMLTKEEIINKVPKKFSDDENWMNCVIDPNYDPSMDDYYAENRTVITNDKNGIPDSALYAALLLQGDQYGGNSDGILTVGEARKITFLSCDGKIADYTNLAKYAPNLITIGVYGGSNWADAEESFIHEYGELKKLSDVSVTGYSDKLLEAICQNSSLTALSISSMGVRDWTPLIGLPIHSLSISVADGLETIVNTLPELTSLSLTGSGININAIDSRIRSKLTYAYFYTYSNIFDSDNSEQYNYDFSDFSSIQNLTVMLPINSVSGLGELPLASLHLDNQLMNNSAVLKDIPNSLTSLSVNGIKVEGLAGNSDIASCSNLYNLSLNNCGVRDIKGVSDLRKLQFLNLAGNEITDISELKELKTLVNLNLNRNQIVDASGLEELTQLKVLDLSYNRLAELPDFSGLSNLSAIGLTSEYQSSLNLCCNLLNKENIKGFVPQMFSDNRLWMAKAASRSFNGTLCYTDLDSQTIVDILYENNPMGTIYGMINVSADCQATLSAELIQLMKDKDIHLSLRFSDCNTGRLIIQYYFEGSAIPLESGKEYVFSYTEQAGTIIEKEAAEAYFSKFVGIPIYYYQNSKDQVGRNLPYTIGVSPASKPETGGYTLYYYDYSKSIVTKLKEFYFYYFETMNTFDFCNFSTNSSGIREVAPELNKTQDEGYYFWAGSQYTVPDSTPGINSEPEYYYGKFYNQGTDLDKVLTERIENAAQGDTIQFASIGSPNIHADAWNQAVDKKLSWDITKLDFRGRIIGIVKVSGADTIKAVSGERISLDSWTDRYMHTPPEPIKGYLNGLEVRYLYEAVFWQKADVSFYVGSQFKNGEVLNLYYYEFPESATNSGNNTIPDAEEYKLFESKIEPMTVSSGMVHYQSGERNGSALLVNGRIDLNAEPDTPDVPDVPEDPDVPEVPDVPSVPDTPKPDTPNTTPDTPGTSKPAADGKQTPAKVDEDKIVNTDQARDTIADKMNKLDPNIEVYTKAPIALDKEIFNDMLKKNKNISVSVVNESNQLMYGWTFEHNQLSQEKLAAFEKLDLGITFATEKQKEIEEITHNNDSLYLNFAYHGELPAPATIKTYVGSQYADGDAVYLYYYNENTGKVEAINGSNGLVVRGGYVTYTITHCSVYFLSTATPGQLGLKAGTGYYKSPRTGENMFPYFCAGIFMLGLAVTAVAYRKTGRERK